MRIDLISAVPQLLSGPLDHSIVGRARASGLVEICIHNLREFSRDKHRKVDDYPFGGGAGMVLTPDPIFRAVRHLQTGRAYDAVIFPTPDAKPFTQADANRLSMAQNILFICGHYKGIDQRVRDVLVTEEFSIGDFVVSGGELPAMMMVDAIVRLIPGALGDAESALTDSFQDGLLDAPWYTRPAVYENLSVPEVLQSGNHAAINKWRHEQSIEKTKRLRPDLLQERR
jgi:tRNA (guanine37-N1)-methyltransferase